jgi:hypothetical protein
MTHDVAKSATMRDMREATTAVRTVRTTRTGKTIATITVTFPDGRTVDVGGARSARAEAVIVGQHPTHVEAGQPVGVYGVRGDLAKAQAEATKLRTATERRIGRNGSTLKITPWVVAEAIPVTEAAE